MGTHRPYPQGGSATFLGFRPRDNQSCSLGYDTRTWFDVLLALGAYPPTGKFSGVNDNTEYLSRTGEYLACRFPNGAITIARHLRLLEEDWQGGFARDAAADAAYLARHPLPPDKLELRDFKVGGHTVTYEGSGAVAFRAGPAGQSRCLCGQRLPADHRGRPDGRLCRESPVAGGVRPHRRRTQSARRCDLPDHDSRHRRRSHSAQRSA